MDRGNTPVANETYLNIDKPSLALDADNYIICGLYCGIATESISKTQANWGL